MHEMLSAPLVSELDTTTLIAMVPPPPDKTSVELEGVPETLLMTLYNRAVESQRLEPILRDNLAVE
jgi:hypothetical protein